MRWHHIVPAILSTALLSFTQNCAAEAPKTIKPVIVLSGSDSAIAEPTIERCCSDKELRALWEIHQGGDNRDRCPQVDFDSFMVIALFKGAHPFGASISFDNIVEDAESIHLRYYPGGFQLIGRKPGDEESEADKLKRVTRSFVIVVLPVSKKAVVIEETTRDSDALKEQKRFPAIDKK